MSLGNIPCFLEAKKWHSFTHKQKIQSTQSTPVIVKAFANFVAM